MIKLHTLWKYIGPGDGENELHRLVFFEPHEVVTAGMNRAWLGTKAEFLKQFVPMSA